MENRCESSPSWGFMNRAKNEIALRQLENDLNTLYEEDFKKMWNEFTSHVYEELKI